MYSTGAKRPSESEVRDDLEELQTDHNPQISLPSAFATENS